MTRPTRRDWTRGNIARTGGDLVNYVQMGDGPILVLLHKLGGWTREWTALAGCLAGERRLIAIDLPGHGESRAAGPPTVQTLEGSAASVLDLLDALQVQRFALAGASLGGAVAAVIASEARARVRGLVLINAPLTAARSATDVAAQDRRTAAELWGEGDRPLPRSVADVARQFGLVDPTVHADLNDSRARAGPWVRASWRGVALGEIAGRLSRITARTLVLFGERLPPSPEARAAVDLLADARLDLIPDAGAFPHQENPHAVAEAMRHRQLL